MKYYIDTEFIEGFHKPLLGRKRHFIDLISIGIVAEDGREYYAISKDFGLKAAWNAYDQDSHHTRNYKAKKVYWLRDNVLKSIFEDWRNNYNGQIVRAGLPFPLENRNMTFKKMKKVIFKYAGKSNKQIAEEIINFVAPATLRFDGQMGYYSITDYLKKSSPEFYGYYADYDWVLFCSLFGRMIDLPTGFPMYCCDLKQMLDEKIKELLRNGYGKNWVDFKNDRYYDATFDEILKRFTSTKDYPKQENEHNALADAKWNKQLHEFLIKLQTNKQKQYDRNSE